MSKNNYLIDFGNRLKDLRQLKGISQEELAHESHLDRTYISMLERNIKSPTVTTIVKIAKALSISPAMFFENTEINEKSFSKKDRIRFPFYGTAVSCGIPVGGDYRVEKELSLNDYLVQSPKKTFFAKASGESMAPLIFHGDLLIIEQTQKCKNNDIILAQINNEFTVKRFTKNAGKIHLLPENPEFKEIILNENDEGVICGVVVGISRRLF